MFLNDHVVIRHQTTLNHSLNTLSRWLPPRRCCREEYNNNAVRLVNIEIELKVDPENVT